MMVVKPVDHPADHRRESAMRVRNKQPQRPASRHHAQAFRGLEPLEDRTLLSATLTAEGVLRIEGTVGDDVIAVVAGQNAGEVTVVQAPGVEDGAVFAGVGRIVIRGFDGGDLISLRPSQQLQPQAAVFDYRNPDGNPMAITIAGGNGDDRIFGSDQTDLVTGGYGADLLMGFGGDDLLNGKQGRDHIEGGAGNDQLFGGPGADQIDGGDDHDMLFGSYGSDILTGGAGMDYVVPGNGNDELMDIFELDGPLREYPDLGGDPRLFVTGTTIINGGTTAEDEYVLVEPIDITSVLSGDTPALDRSRV
jgi:Ca2+-binding RTX toxin-like protein